MDRITEGGEEMRRTHTVESNKARGMVRMMDTAAEAGWCIVLKKLPPDLPWLIQGSRSEFDAPCKDKQLSKDTWCCEAQYLRHDVFMHTCFRIATEAYQAVALCVWEIEQETKRVTTSRKQLEDKK
jgi:hypothetical protein